MLLICIFHLWSEEPVGTVRGFVYQQYSSLLVNPYPANVENMASS
jgi:hypothetical protein